MKIRKKKKNFNEAMKFKKFIRCIQDPLNIQDGNLPGISSWLKAVN